LLAVSIELLTVFVRFKFKLRTKDVLVKIMHHYNWKKVVHFHHGFVGIIIILVAMGLGYGFGINIGWGVLISDVIHHFLVLWPIMGSPEFHVLYKNVGEMNKEEKLEKKKIGRLIKELSG